MAPLGDAASPVKGGNTEDGDGGVNSDASDFCEGAEDGISSTEGGNKATDRVIEGENRDKKDYIFKDGSDDRTGVENDTLDFDNRAASGVAETRDGDVKSDVFEDGSDDDTRAKNNTLDFNVRAADRVTKNETKTSKAIHLKMAVTTEQKPKNDTLDFGNGTTGGVTGARDGDSKGDTFLVFRYFHPPSSLVFFFQHFLQIDSSKK